MQLLEVALKTELLISLASELLWWAQKPWKHRRFAGRLQSASASGERLSG